MAVVGTLKHNNKQGFTIVELLIVIVIIGILAALIIMAYSGIQQRARNTQRIASAKEWQKVLNTYVNQEGKYPYTTTNACLGDGYPTDWDANPDQDCHRKSTLIVHSSATLNTEIKKVTSTMPSFPKDAVGLSGSDLVLGLSYLPNQTVDGSANRIKVNFWLEGINQSCGMNVLDASGNSTSPVNTQGDYAGAGKATLCVFTINDAANL